MSITAHCIIKNEEIFIEYVLRSVVNFVDHIIIYDTGSTDKTIEIVTQIKSEFPQKITFEQKGICDKKRHTELRNEMIDKTSTGWFMILDGDEVWPRRTMEEALVAINNDHIECVIAPFYLCVGDIYHRYFHQGHIRILDQTGNFYPRFIKITKGVRWQGDYNVDTLVDENNDVFFRKENTVFIKNRYWHLTHLSRSRITTDYSSGGTRGDKIIKTYFIIGRKIKEAVPEVFVIDKFNKLNYLKSVINFFSRVIKKIIKNFDRYHNLKSLK